ncbi:MAG: hypothetical protein WC752_00720 [Patescibacteria group bacterium]|jgi:hypothetical protein
MHKEKITKRILILFGLFLAGCAIVLIFRPDYLWNIIIVYAPASLLNFYWLRKSKFKILLFSVVTTLLFAIPIELMARLTDSWDVQSTLPRLFGIAPLENTLYAFINFFWPLCFYEAFVDRDRSKRISRRWKYLVTTYIALSFIVYLLFSVNRQMISLDYWQLAIFILVIPGILLFSRNTKLIKKAIPVTIFFGIIFFCHEVMSLYLGHWWWPGEYLMPFTLWGKTFPLDDVIIWYLLSTPVLIGGYEFFMDDFR